MAHPLLSAPPLWPLAGATTTAGDPPIPPTQSKLKLLCSFGGQILPRPGDGTLRYAGGHTRLISVPRTVTFPDLILRLSNSCNSTTPMVLKYQLPDEDLEALVSVSCPEDLDNMLEEFDKLTRSHPGASPKLRAFLFTPGELRPDPDDATTRYLEAINGYAASDSRSSSGSADGNAEGISPTTLPVSAAWPEPPPPPLPPAYIHTLPPAMVAGVPPLNKFVTFVPPQPYLPVPVSSTGIQVTTAALAASLNPIQPNLEAWRLENQRIRLESCFMCQKALPHAHSDAVLREQQGIETPMPVGVSNTNPVFHRFNSEMTAAKVIAPVVAGAPGDKWVNVATPGVVTGAPVDNWVKTSALMGSRLITGAPAESWVKAAAPVGTRVPVGNWVGRDSVAHGFPHRQINAGVVLPPCSMGFLGGLPQHHLGHLQQQEEAWKNGGAPRYHAKQEMITSPFSVDAGVVIPPCSMGLCGNPLGPQQQHEGAWQNRGSPWYPVKQEMVTNPFSVDGALVVPPCSTGLLGHVPRYHIDPLQGQQQSPQYQVKQEVITNPFMVDANSARNQNPYTPQIPECSFEYMSPVDVFHRQWKAIAKSDSSEMVQANGGNHGLQPIPNLGIVTERNFVHPIDQLPPTSMYDPCMPNLRHDDPACVLNGIVNDPYPPNLGVILEPPPRWVHGMPAGNTELDYNDRAINNTPASQGGIVMFPLSNTSPTTYVEPFEEEVSSDSLFSNEDPWKVLGGAYLLPRKPSWVAKNELPVSNESSCMENHPLNRNDANAVSLLEESILRYPPGHPNKGLSPEPIRFPKEENILLESQAVRDYAEDPVLQSFIPPLPVFFAQGTKEHNSEDTESRVIDDSAELHGAVPILDNKIKDIKASPLDNILAALQIREGIGCLQIIKNSDLEELKELGSGTYGTAFHGKWRGSDVAIKRISDRCFAGKASEVERMRTDFWNEACQLADLHHPNVVAFYGVVLDGPGGSVATVTEYMVNGSLRTALHGSGKMLDWRKRLLIAMDVAFGMEYLHGKNIVHFDLKSDNLLVNLRDPQRPICKVSDLGLSKVKCQTLISGGVRGTLPWMAPELLDGSRNLVSEKVDVFSYGIVMWELLTGEEPYADMHYGAIIGGIVSNTLRPPIPKSCDIQWKLLMEMCWSSEPLERPSFTEIADALRSMAASLPQKGRS